MPLGKLLRLGAAIIGGGALNQGLAVVAVVTDHSPLLVGTAVAGVRALYAVLRLLPVRGLAVLVPDRESEGSEDRRDEDAPVAASPPAAAACVPAVYMAKSLDEGAGVGPALPLGPNTASAANRLYSAFSAFLRCFSSFSMRLRSSLSSLAISLGDRCDTSFEISMPASGVDLLWLASESRRCRLLLATLVSVDKLCCEVERDT